MVVVHIFDARIQKAKRQTDFCEFKARMVYRVISRKARATQ